MESSTATENTDRLRGLASRLGRDRRLVPRCVPLTLDREITLFWNARYEANAWLARSSGEARPIALIENIYIPPERLPEFFRRMQAVMRQLSVTAAYAGHVGHGVIHVSPLLNLADERQRQKLAPLFEESRQVVRDLGGTLYGEHGTGLLRAGLVKRDYPDLYPVFQEVKACFDPRGILNPGRIVNGQSGIPLALLRRTGSEPANITSNAGEPKAPMQLLWPGRNPLAVAGDCNGCGACRSAGPVTRMCPSFRAEPSELASPRSKANLLRQVLTGALSREDYTSDLFREIADHCVNCKSCRWECPSQVDIARLMLEAKAAYVAEHGLPGTDWFFANIDTWIKRASANAALANRLMASPIARWILEKVVGLARGRRIPAFASESFANRARRLGWTTKPDPDLAKPRVAFFADTFVNYFEPDVGEAIVRVLMHHRRAVFVPTAQGASGQAPLHFGDLPTARIAVERNVALFAELVREGYEIVTAEPAATVMYRLDASAVLKDRDLTQIASRIVEFSDFVSRLRQSGELQPFRRTFSQRLGYHEPCHRRATRQFDRTDQLMAQIPGLTIDHLDHGCSGMAGVHGLRSASAESSRLAGQRLFQAARDPNLVGLVSECGSCRMQLAEYGQRSVYHPALWFAWAYGLLPESGRDRPETGR